MAERIELPQTPSGTAEEQLKQMYSYLYRVAQALNHNLSEIGSMDLTDEERMVMQQITAKDSWDTAAGYDWQGKESLKSLIIKTAAFVQNALDSYRLNLLGEYVAEGKFGRYVRNTGLKVDVTPTGIQQDFTFEEVVQGLKTYTINAKNYIKTGLLRTVQSIPVYGVAIGKDVVTFAEDGTETYNDGNKVAELTADELSFYQGGNKVASYTGNKISFLMGGSEIMYIQGGKICCAGDLEIATANKMTIKNGTASIWEFDKKGLTYKAEGSPLPFQIMDYDDRDYLTNGVFYQFSQSEQTGEVILLAECRNGEHTSESGFWRGEVAVAMTDNEGDLDTITQSVILYPKASRGVLGTRYKPWQFIFTRDIIGKQSNGGGTIAFSPHPSLDKRQFGIQMRETEYTEDSTTKEHVFISSTDEIEKFSIQGMASESNFLYGFDTINGLAHIVGKQGENIIAIRPNPSPGYQNVRIYISEAINANNEQVVRIYKDSNIDQLELFGKLIGDVTGNLTGNVTGKINNGTTSETTLNNIKEKGDYWLNMTNIGGGPSGVTGTQLVRVDAWSTSIVQQTIYTSDAIYSRRFLTNWGSWYKFTGTAV